MKIKTLVLQIIGIIFYFAACTTIEKVEKFADKKPAKYDLVTLNHYRVPKHTPSFKKIVDSLYPYRMIQVDTTYVYDSAAVANQVFAFIQLADSAYQDFIRQYYVPKDSLVSVRDSSAQVLSTLARNLIKTSVPCTTIQRITVTVKDSLESLSLKEQVRYQDSVYSGQITILENKLDKSEKDRDMYKERSRNTLWALLSVIGLIVLIAVFFIYRALKSARPALIKTS